MSYLSCNAYNGGTRGLDKLLTFILRLAGGAVNSSTGTLALNAESLRDGFLDISLIASILDENGCADSDVDAIDTARVQQALITYAGVPARPTTLADFYTPAVRSVALVTPPADVPFTTPAVLQAAASLAATYSGWKSPPRSRLRPVPSIESSGSLLVPVRSQSRSTPQPLPPLWCSQVTRPPSRLLPQPSDRPIRRWRPPPKARPGAVRATHPCADLAVGRRWIEFTSTFWDWHLLGIGVHCPVRVRPGR